MTSQKNLEKIRICLLNEIADCVQTLKAAEIFNVPIVFSNTGEEYLNDTEWKTYFVLKEFQGGTFDTLTKYKQRYFNFQ